MSIYRRFSAVFPLATSFGLLVMLAAHVLRFGIVHEADEGTQAHIFQILMPVQFCVAVFFAAKWLPRCPGPAARVLALQCGAAVSVLAAVRFFT